MKTDMRLRTATAADVPAISAIAFSAFTGSLLYDHFSPLNAEHPKTFQRFLRDEIRLRMVMPGQVIIVAEMPLGHSDETTHLLGADKDMEIVGYSVWICRGFSETRTNWSPDSLYKRIMRCVIFLESCCKRLFSPDRTSCLATIRGFHATAKEILDSAGVGEHIELNTLAVHPGRQRMGIGAKLMQWGMKKAEEEYLHVVLEATEAGVSLYGKMGFVRVGNVILAAKNADSRHIDELTVPVMVLSVVNKKSADEISMEQPRRLATETKEPSFPKLPQSR